MSATLEASAGWVVMRRRSDGQSWYPLGNSFAPKRAAAIAAVNKQRKNWYRQARRKGIAKVMRCTLEPFKQLEMFDG